MSILFLQTLLIEAAGESKLVFKYFKRHASEMLPDTILTHSGFKSSSTRSVILLKL